MSLTTRCPYCSTEITYEAENVGAVWLCPSCQARVTLAEPPAMAPPPIAPPIEIAPPPPFELAPPTPLPSTEIAPAPTDAPVISDLPATAAQDAPVLDAVIEPANPLKPWLIGVSVAAGVLVLALVVILALPHLQTKPTWEQLHSQEILDTKAEAERLLARDDLHGAYARFDDLARLAAGNPVNDPVLKTALQTAADEQTQTLDQLLQQARQAAAPAAQPTIIVASPTTSPVTVAEAPPPPPKPAYPLVHRLPPPEVAIDDERIGHAIQSGVDNLMDDFDQGRLRNSTGYPDGDVDALVVYALVQAYQATDDPRLDPKRLFMKAALDNLTHQQLNDAQSTYGRSLRLNALALAGRKEDRDVMQGDVQFLLAGGSGGAFTYPTRLNERVGNMANTVWDNSNSQYGLLGLWAAADAGIAVPKVFWQEAENHWISTQLPDGRWSYNPGDTDQRPAMTLAGLASLLVAQDFLYDPSTDEAVGREPYIPAIKLALSYLESGNNAVFPFHENWSGYSLYGLERVGLASGFKYFGSHDWYRESAADILASASPDGSWGGQIETSFALLFLARGRHPILMNKLRFDGDWANRPRDVSNLARYCAKTLEHQLNWQIVPISHDWEDWTDGPIVYIASNEPPKLSAAEEDKLRQFVLNGGLLLTQADGGSLDFNQWVAGLGSRLFPAYPWAPLPADHPLLRVGLHLTKTPHVAAISNGSRILMLHLPEDISHFWQARDDAAHPDEFNLGLNIFLYACGRTNLRNRIVTTAIAATPDAPAATIDVAQLRVGSDSAPEPAAWPRFARWFRRETDLGIDLTTTPLEDLHPETAPLAHLTGVAGFHPTDPQCDALRNYVDSGGVVLIDPCGGPNDFLNSVRGELVPKTFPRGVLERLDKNSRLLTNSGDGMSQLGALQVRDYVRGLDPPIERGLWMLRDGKGAIIVSSLDITSGLLGTSTWGIAGFTPDYSLALAKNVVLWTWDGAKN